MQTLGRVLRRRVRFFSSRFPPSYLQDIKEINAEFSSIFNDNLATSDSESSTPAPTAIESNENPYSEYADEFNQDMGDLFGHFPPDTEQSVPPPEILQTKTTKESLFRPKQKLENAPELLVLNGACTEYRGLLHGTNTPLVDLTNKLTTQATRLGFAMESYSTNSTEKVIDRLLTTNARGILLNPGAIPSSDPILQQALKMIDVPVIIIQPDGQHHLEFPPQTKVIAGFGAASYTLALEALYSLMN